MTLKDVDVEIIKCPVCKANQFKQRADCLRCGSALAGADIISTTFNTAESAEITVPAYQTGTIAAPTVVNLENRVVRSRESVYSRPTQILEQGVGNQASAHSGGSGRFAFLIIAGTALLIVLMGIVSVIVIAGLNSTPAQVYSNQEGVGNIQKSPDSSPLPEITPPGVNLQVPSAAIQPSAVTNPKTTLPVAGSQSSPATARPTNQAQASATPVPSLPAQSLVATPTVVPSIGNQINAPTTKVDNEATCKVSLKQPSKTNKISATCLFERKIEKEPAQNKVINQVAFSPDGQILATANINGDINLWSIPGLNSIRTLKFGSVVYSLSFSQKGADLLLASAGASNSIKIWDLTNLPENEEIVTKSQNEIETPSKNIYAVAFSQDGQMLASGGDDKLVYLWDVETRHEINRFEWHKEAIQTLEFFTGPNALYLASGSDDNTIKIWDFQKDKLLTPPSGHSASVYQVTFNSSQKLLASGSLDGSIKLWDLKSSLPTQTFTNPGNKVYSISFSPDGQFLASGNGKASGNGDGTITLWDTATGKELQTLGGFDQVVHSVAFSPDGKYLAAGSYDGWLRIYSIAYQKS